MENYIKHTKCFCVKHRNLPVAHRKGLTKREILCYSVFEGGSCKTRLRVSKNPPTVKMQSFYDEV